MDITALADLLSQSRQESDEEHDIDRLPRVTPATIVPAAPVARDAAAERAAAGRKGGAGAKDIWDAEEVPSEREVISMDDGRKRPEYEILYKQSVGSQDVFLGMGDKDPSSLSCEAMVVRIVLPGCRGSDLDLNVTAQELVLTAPTHKLALYLPHKVQDDKGNAKWDAAKQVLSVTLPIVRE